MPFAIRTLGDVLECIDNFDFGSAIYLLPEVAYELGTPCIVTSLEMILPVGQEASVHEACLHYGFRDWFDLAVVSDVYDEVSEPTKDRLIDAFNLDCKEGYLAFCKNFRRPRPVHTADPIAESDS